MQIDDDSVAFRHWGRRRGWGRGKTSAQLIIPVFLQKRAHFVKTGGGGGRCTFLIFSISELVIDNKKVWVGWSDSFPYIITTPVAVDSSIRLYGGSSDKEGAVQVNVTGEWRNICNDGWDALDALVTCRQLGLTEGYALLWYDTTNIWGTTEAPTNWLNTEGNEFACNGNEKTLLSCKHTKSSTYCPQRAGVACGTSVF